MARPGGQQRHLIEGTDPSRLRNFAILVNDLFVAVAAIREKVVTVDEADHLPGAAELAVAACAARADSVTDTVGLELPTSFELVKGRLRGHGCPRGVLLTGDEHRAMTAG